MSAVLLTPQPVDWECPNCPATDRTAGETNRYHPCPGLRGLAAPMVRAGSRARVLAVDREDYAGRELVQRDGDGRPVAAIVTLRPDGSNDTVVLAPTSRGGVL